MRIAEVKVAKTTCETTRLVPIPKGIVGATVSIEYTDSAWDGLQKTVVFRSAVTKDVLAAGNEVVVPAEVVSRAGVNLYMGVYGVGADGRMVIPTIWTELGLVNSAAAPSGDTSTDPSLPVWAQIQAAIGNLDDLDTVAKSSLVAAVNEALTRGGGEVDPATVHKIVDDYLKANPPGAGADGKDGITPTIGENGNWYLGNTDTGKPSRGENGAVPDIQIGTVTTLPAGSDATASMGGTAENPLLNLGIPRGADGQGGGSGGTDISLGLTSATVGQTIKIKSVDANGRPTAWEATDATGSGTKEVLITETVTTNGTTIIDSSAQQQTVNLAWNIPAAREIPAFSNYYIEKSNITYPRAFNTAAYTQTWAAGSFHGNEAEFVQGHKYFCAMYIEMDDNSTVTLSNWDSPVTPDGTTTISGNGWVYGVRTPTNVGDASFMLSNTNTGTGTIKYLYCIDVTGLLDAGIISSIAINDLVSTFGGLPLIPGQNFDGETTDGSATLVITRDGENQSISSSVNTATIQGGDLLTIDAGSVTFIYKTTKNVAASIKRWEGRKWCAFGDSLTDPSINATKKYHAIIAEDTGITVTVLGKGGTGYYKTKDDGTAYYQRMANCPSDVDVITIFGSVNDWKSIKNGGLSIGNPSDDISTGTYSGYVNGCIDVALSSAPYAQIALITPMDYHGVPDDTLESIANALLAVAKYRKIKCLDLYHEAGFRVDDFTFAEEYTTDYSTTAETYGHPSNVAHEKIIAPEFLELLKRMILFV